MINNFVWLFGCLISLTFFTYAGINLDRVILCFLVILCIKFINKVYINNDKLVIIIFSIIWYIYLITYVLHDNEKSDVLRFIIAYIYIPIVFYLGYTLRCIDNDRYKLEQILKFWLFMFFLFFIYSYYNYFWLNNYHLPIISLFSIESENHFKQAKALRTFLPFFSAPHLSAVSGFIFVYFYLFGKDKRCKLYSFVAFVIVLSTLSRGPLVSIVLVLTFYVSNRLLKGRLPYDLLIYFVIGIVVLLSIDTDNIRILDKLIHITEGRHFSLRFDTVMGILDFDLRSHLLGLGIGSFPYYIKGDYSFTSFLTIYFEMGIIGLILFLFFYFSYFLNAFIMRKRLSIINVTLILYIIFVNLFYELKTLLPLYFLLGYLYIEIPKSEIKQ